MMWKFEDLKIGNSHFFWRMLAQKSSDNGTRIYLKHIYSIIKSPNYQIIKLLFLYIIFCPSPLLSQQKPATEEEELKREIIYDGKRYKAYSNWVSFGGGPAIKVTSRSTQFAGDISYNFHIKKEYFQAGVVVSGDRFGENNNIMWHGAYGKRFETNKYCWATWAGLTHASYYPYVDSLGGYIRKINKTPGIYVASQFFGKLKYDIGIGPSAFFSYYFDKQYLVGLRIDVFFSGAYKGREE